MMGIYTYRKKPKKTIYKVATGRINLKIPILIFARHISRPCYCMLSENLRYGIVAPVRGVI